jgi:hypothetical protein
LAKGIIQAMERRDAFDADDIRRRIVKGFGRAAWRERAMAIYDRVATHGIEARK